MATTTISGSTVTFSNSGAAANLSQTGTEDGTLAFTFDVLAASGGGKNTTIYSVDDGAVDTVYSGTLSNNFKTYDTDLLFKDDSVGSWQLGGDVSDQGAHVWIGTDNKIHYDASNLNAQIQALGQGEVFTDTVKYTIKMSNGTLSVGTLTVVINGTNDAPVITSGAQAGTVKEDTTLTATGTVTSSDVDHGATAAYSGNATGTYGSFAIDASTGVWTYTLANAGHQDLAEGESHTETFKVTVTDDKGATSTQDVLITINGTNDAPVITSGAQAGTVKEDTTLTATGTVTSSDVDHGATAAYSGNATGTYGSFAIDANAAQSTGGDSMPPTWTARATFVAQTDAAGSNGYGKFSIDAAGTWTYTMNNAHDEFVGGQDYTDSITVKTADGTSQVITVTMHGTNDASASR